MPWCRRGGCGASGAQRATAETLRSQRHVPLVPWGRKEGPAWRTAGDHCRRTERRRRRLVCHWRASSCWGHTRPPPHTEQPAALQRVAVPFPCRASPRVCSTGRKGFSLRSRLAQLVTRRSWEHEAGASQRPGTRPGPRQPSARGRWSPQGPLLSGRPVRCCRVVLLLREVGQRERLWPPLHSRRGARRPPRWPWLAVPRLHS